MKINKDKVLVGSDFEMFLQDRNGKFISAIPYNIGTKVFPEEIMGHNGCCIQHDGVLQECNVPPVRLDQSDLFWDNFCLVKDHINEKFANKEDLELVCCPTAEFEEDQLQDEEAKRMGCSVDFNAWRNGEMNEKSSEFSSNLRSCGLHTHFSYPEANIESSITLMKLFDLFVTVPFVLIDTDKKRRELYGKAGSFRLCDWGEVRGFEARTLSNFVLTGKDLVEYLFNQLNEMFNYYNSGNIEKVLDQSDKIIDCINNSDENMAAKLCEEFGILLPLAVME